MVVYLSVTLSFMGELASPKNTGPPAFFRYLALNTVPMPRLASSERKLDPERCEKSK